MKVLGCLLNWQFRMTAVISVFASTAVFAVAPVMDPILQPFPAVGVPNSGPVEIPEGKTLLLPVTASDADNAPLKWITSSTSPSIVYPTLLQNLPCLKLSVDYTTGSGELYFLLLKNYAPTTVRTLSGLVNAGYYNGLKFHRIIKGFMAQGGDKAGTGSGSAPIQFDDEWNPTMVFTGRGQLAMAKAGDDTNGTQFFVTFSPQRHLDFNHIIFGQLIRGWDVLATIESKGSQDESGTPVSPVTITKAEFVTNATDALLRLSAKPNASIPAQGITGDVTVRVYEGDDPNSSYAYHSFTPIVKTDTDNSKPYLLPVRDVYADVDQPAKIIVRACDLENDRVTYGFSWSNTDITHHANGDVDQNILTLTPDAGFAGYEELKVGVSHLTNPGPWSNYNDTQIFRVCWGEKPVVTFPSTINGKANVELANAQICRFVDGDPAGTDANFQAAVYWGDGTSVDNSSTARPVTVSFNALNKILTVTGSHTYAWPGEYPVTVYILGDRGLRQTSESHAKIAP